jgi:hypothetical protein
LPRRFARYWLELLDVTVERVQEILVKSCKAEGVLASAAAEYDGCYRGAFRDLWDSTNGAGAWERNDWVWVLKYRKLAEAREEARAV